MRVYQPTLAKSPSKTTSILSVARGGLLQRKCACGGTPGPTECEGCSRKKRLGLQTKLRVNEPGDIYEQEADRIADQVTAESANPLVRSSPPHIHRFTGQATEQSTVPASVDRAVASPGRPLDPVLRQDMEQRFGYDFSRVRVHSGGAAEQSVRDVNAHAYTVGHNIVFGAGQYTPGTREGQRLLAHELVHVRQQEAAGDGAGYGLFRDKKEGKPQPPPPKTETTSPTKDEGKPQPAPPKTAATPCIPKFNSLKVEMTGSVSVMEVDGRCQLILGTPDKAKGAMFTSKIDVPAGCTGTVQYVQLIDMCHGVHITGGNDLRRKTGGDWIDTRDPIVDQQVSDAGSVEFKGSDQPGQPVPGSVDGVQAKDSFKLWLMWKPDQPANADRVPLAMATWKWSAEAKLKNPDEKDCAKRWTVTKGEKTGGTGKATKASPAATKTVTSKDPATEEGKSLKC